MILYRPVDLNELRLIYDSGMCVFPPRLPEQPIFYPVLNFEYAEQIAREWNTRGTTRSGFVTRFEVGDEYVARFETQRVGAWHHVELWVPAEELETFNANIAAPIEVVGAYFGNDFQGHVAEAGSLRGQNATGQWVQLAAIFYNCRGLAMPCPPGQNATEFEKEIVANHRAVFLNYSFWTHYLLLPDGIAGHRRRRMFKAIDTVWSAAFPSVRLPHETPRTLTADKKDA